MKHQVSHEEGLFFRAILPAENSSKTTINDPADFKSFRTPEGKPDAAPAWHGMRKGIADLHRRAEISQACNDRYLRALASVTDTTSLGELTARLCQPVRHNGRRARPFKFNPHAPDDAKLLDVISRGVADAFDLSREDPRVLAHYDTSRLYYNEEVQQWYDMHRASNLLGKQMLLARRLCEAGCGFVTVSDQHGSQ